MSVTGCFRPANGKSVYLVKSPGKPKTLSCHPFDKMRIFRIWVGLPQIKQVAAVRPGEYKIRRTLVFESCEQVDKVLCLPAELFEN